MKKPLKERFLKLKVYRNKKTGQNLLMLPKKDSKTKKKLGKVPKIIKVLKW